MNLLVSKILKGSFLILFLGTPSWSEGRLETFEREANEGKPKTPSSGSSARRSTTYHFGSSKDKNRFSENLAEAVLVTGAAGLALGGAQAHEVSQSRGAGDPVLPIVRIDAGFQWVDENVDAWDIGGGIGWSVLGVTGRHTQFTEQGVDQDLRFTQAHVVYRMAILNQFEMGLGFGAAWLRGGEKETGFSFALPMRYWPKENVGIEVMGAWTAFDGVRLTDVESALVVQFRGINVRAGYRWLELEDDRGSLSGFRVGVGFRY
jgi:hypothetical protein